MNYMKSLIIACEFMAARIILVLICATSVIVELTRANLLDQPQHQQIEGITFLEQPKDVTVSYSETVIFECSVTSVESNVKWFHNEREIKDQSATNGTSFLILKGKKKQPGVYHCIVHTILGKLRSRNATLKIAELSKPVLKIGPVKSLGDSARLFCDFNSTSAANVSWKFGENLIRIDGKKYSTLPGVLYVNDLQLKDSGNYSCVVKNLQIKKEETGSATLEVSDEKESQKLKFLSPVLPDTKFIRQLSEVKLECYVGLADVQVVWTKKVDFGREKIIVEAQSAYNSLEFGEMTQDKNGRYTCTAHRIGSSEEISMSIVLNSGTPPVLKKKPASYRCKMISVPVRLECTVDGLPKPQVTWLFNGKVIGENDNFKRKLVKLNDYDLVIPTVSANDEGAYQCFFENEFGFVSSEAVLVVQPNSLAPPVSNLRCKEINSSAISVSFDYEFDSNLAPVLYRQREIFSSLSDELDSIGDTESDNNLGNFVFLVKYFPEDEKGKPRDFPVPYQNRRSGGIAHQSAIINDLKADTKYSISVYAYTGQTGSPSSELVDCKTKNDVSMYVDVKLIYNDTLFLIWTKMSQGSEYEVQINQNNSIKMVTIFNSMFVYDLKPDIPCVITVVRLSPNLPDDKSMQYTVEVTPSRHILPKIRVHFINNTTALFAWDLLNKPNNMKEFRIVYYEIGKENFIERSISNNRDYLLCSDLNFGAWYNITLYVILFDYEAKLWTEVFEFKDNSDNVLSLSTSDVRAESPYALLVTWFAQFELDKVRPLFVVEYHEKGSNDTKMAVSREIKARVNGLKPSTEYEFLIRVFDEWNRRSDYTEMMSGCTDPMLTDVRARQINSSAVQVMWKQPEYCDPNSRPLYILSYHATDAKSFIRVPEYETSQIVTNLKENVDYYFDIIYRNGNREGKSSETVSVTLKSDKVEMPIKTDMKDEQLMGVLIGSCIGAVIIALCVTTVFCCKKRIEKYYTSRNQISAHEMNYLKNPVEMNGYNTNFQRPLLNGSCSNNCSNSLANGHYSSPSGKSIHDEGHKLLNSDSPIDETYHAMETDHEGGDSGYCDRNQSQSPQLSYHSKKQSKHTDVTMEEDYGFYENEARNGISTV